MRLNCPVPKGAILVSALFSIGLWLNPPMVHTPDQDLMMLGKCQSEKLAQLRASVVDLTPTKKKALPTVCTEGSSRPKEAIQLTRNLIESFGNARLDPLKRFTYIKYEKCIMNDAGKEHYSLLHYLTANYGDCRHVVDIETRYAASALALGATGINVHTFDRPESTERKIAIQRVGTEAEWQQQVKEAGVNIDFHNVNLITIANEEFQKYMNTWLIMLDTAHLPDTQPFEREFFQDYCVPTFKAFFCWMILFI